MAPIYLMGRWGTPVPHRVPLTVALGRPLGLPACASPSDEVVAVWLDRYIAELQRLFEEHKAAAGHKTLELRIM